MSHFRQYSDGIRLDKFYADVTQSQTQI